MQGNGATTLGLVQLYCATQGLVQDNGAMLGLVQLYNATRGLVQGNGAT